MQYITSCAFQVNDVAEVATKSWWDEQHPGWMIFTLGNRHFETLDQIVQVPAHISPVSAANSASSPPRLWPWTPVCTEN